MTHQIESEEQVAGGIPRNTDIQMFRLRYQAFLYNRNLQQKCTIKAEKLGNWFILTGIVNSQHTKLELFRLVPRIEGAQWIVDQIQVGKNLQNALD